MVFLLFGCNKNLTEEEKKELWSKAQTTGEIINRSGSPFNSATDKFKLGCSVDHHKSFKFPLAKTSIYTLHSLEDELYKKFISGGIESDLSVGSTQMRNILE